MAAFTDPFANLPGIVVQKEDGNLNVFENKTGPIVLILGTASSGPSNRLVEVDRVSEGVALFGTDGTLSRGLVEAAQAGVENLAAYRVGALPATAENVGDRLLAGGATVETVDADGSVADDFSLLYEQGASTFVTNAGAYTDNGRVKRLRVYDALGNLVYDNDPVGGAVVDSGDVLVSGTLDITTRGPSIGRDVRGRNTDQHNLLIDPSVAGGANADECLSRGAAFAAMGFSATAPMKLLIERAVGHFEEVQIDAVDSAERLNVAVDFPVASRSEIDTQAGLDGEIDAQPAGVAIFLRNLTTNGAGGAQATNDAVRVSVFGIDTAGDPAIVHFDAPNSTGGGADDSAASATLLQTITGVRTEPAVQAGPGLDGQLQVRTAGGLMVAVLPADGNDQGLDITPMPDGPAGGNDDTGLFGAVGLHHSNAAADGDFIVVRGPGIARQHIMPAAGDTVEVVSAGAENNGVDCWIFGYNLQGFPVKEIVTIAGPATQTTVQVYASVTGVALSSPALTTNITIREQADNTQIVVFAGAASPGGDQFFGMVAEDLVLPAGGAAAVAIPAYVSSLAKFSGLWQVEVGAVAAASTVSYRKLRMFRIIRTDLGEPMSQARFPGDNWATTSVAATDLVSATGLSCSPVVIPGEDGLNPSKERLFEILQDAYRALETTNVDIVVPMGAYLDDVNVADDADLVRTVDSGADGAFLADDVDEFGRFMTFTSAGGGFDALGILGADQVTLVITETTFQDGALNELRRSARVLRTGDADGGNTDTKLQLDRELTPNPQATLDWLLIGNGPLGGPAVASDHLRFFRQEKVDGQWIYEWWHEADQQDPDGGSYEEVNFGYQLANFCYQLSTNDNNCRGVIGVNRWASKRLQDLDTWSGVAPTRNTAGAVTVDGSGLLGNKFMAGRTDWTRGLFAVTGVDLANWPASDDIIVDTNGNNVDIGKYLDVVAAWPNFINTFDSTGFGYLASGAAAYAGMVSKLESNSAPTNKVVGRGIRMPLKLAKSIRDSLAAAGYVWFDVRDKGVVVDDSPTAALPTSDYRRLTTVRIVTEAVDEVRKVAEPFLGEASTGAVRAAIETAVRKKLSDMTRSGHLRRYDVAVTATAVQQILGRATIELVLVPQFELRKITVLVSLARE